MILNYYKCGCKIPENAIYIGRKFKDLPQSIYANPFKITDKMPREEVIEKYDQYILNKLMNGQFVKELLALDGKDLVCFCAPKSCHGDVLLKYIDIVKQL